MGSFATSIFNLLLGWIRGLVSSLWSLVNSQEARSSLEWLGDHWLWLVIAIGVAGLVIDYLIWFIRWRPYYVWRSWWRRLTHRGEPEPAPSYEPYDEAPAQEVYPQAYYPEAYYPQEYYSEEYAAQEENVWQEPVHPGLTDTGIQESLGWPEERQWPEEVVEEQAPPPRQRRSQREADPLHRMRSGISQMAQRMDFMGLGREDEDAEDYSYIAPPPAVDKEQAFRAPVYPAYWKKQEDDQ